MTQIFSSFLVRLTTIMQVTFLLSIAPASHANATFSLGFEVPNSPAPTKFAVETLPGNSIVPGSVLTILASGQTTQQYCFINLGIGCAHQPAITTNPNGLQDPSDPNSFVYTVDGGNTTINGQHLAGPTGAVWGIFSQVPLVGYNPSGLIWSFDITHPDLSAGPRYPNLGEAFFIGTGIDYLGQPVNFVTPANAAHLLIGSWINGDVVLFDNQRNIIGSTSSG